MRRLAVEWRKGASRLTPPSVPTNIRTVRLAEIEGSGKPIILQPLFELRIGDRILKKDIHKVTQGLTVWSANVRKPFGYVTDDKAGRAKAGGLTHGGALWSIDSDFDCRHVAPGDDYAITDHCGQIAILVNDIDPAYLAAQVRQAGMDYGFNRDFRPSLELMRKLEIALPINAEGGFDLDLMQQWSTFREKMELFRIDMSKLVN